MHVPAGWHRDSEGRLLIAGKPVAALAEAQGTPLFLYSAPMVAARVARFRAAMPAGLRLHYAVKANPMPALLAHLAPLVDGFDVASAGELARVRAAAPRSHIGFAGPGKRDGELAEALAQDVLLNVESAGELERICRMAQASGRAARVAVRVNPPFQLRGSGMKMGGMASPFGVDAADVPVLLREMRGAPLLFEGFHLFAGSQNLDWESVVDAQRQALDLAARLAAEAPARPRLVTLGGGFGVPYFPADRPLDVAAIGCALAAAFGRLPAALSETVFALELGRWLVAEAGLYVVRVVDRKASGGETFLVTDGGLHHQLAATGNFGTVVRRNYPLAAVGAPDGAEETVHVVGCLCTPLDRLADRARLPRLEPGDLLAVFMAGAYGRTASPENFLGHPAPGELLVFD
ncbi:MAG: pyridoxal-dependent decarboxylase, exosortase A system-associated [Thermaurantiacus sp.]